MNAFYKVVENGYIEGFGTNGSGDTTAVTEAEYGRLLEVFRARPTRSGYDYRLREDLTWEETEAEPDPEEELTAGEIAAAIEEALA